MKVEIIQRIIIEEFGGEKRIIERRQEQDDEPWANSPPGSTLEDTGNRMAREMFARMNPEPKEVK